MTTHYFADPDHPDFPAITTPAQRHGVQLLSQIVFVERNGSDILQSIDSGREITKRRDYAMVTAYTE